MASCAAKALVMGVLDNTGQEIPGLSGLETWAIQAHQIFLGAALSGANVDTWKRVAKGLPGRLEAEIARWWDRQRPEERARGFKQHHLWTEEMDDGDDADAAPACDRDVTSSSYLLLTRSCCQTWPNSTKITCLSRHSSKRCHASSVLLGADP